MAVNVLVTIWSVGYQQLSRTKMIKMINLLVPMKNKSHLKIVHMGIHFVINMKNISMEKGIEIYIL